MLNNIRPYYDSQNVCIENMYTSICKMLKRDHKKIYAYSWNFGYDESEKLQADKIKNHRDRHIVNSEQNYAMEIYCGIKPIWHINCKMEHFLELVRSETFNGRPVGIGIDIYSCYWHSFYRTHHFIHFCLIIGIDEKGFICIDDTLENYDGDYILSERIPTIQISFEQYRKYSSCFITFKFFDTSLKANLEEITYLAALKTLTGFNGKSDYDYMRIARNSIAREFDIREELEETDDPKAIRIIRNFASIGWYRGNFCKFLKDDLQIGCLNIPQICQELCKSAELWKCISNYILMYAMTDNDMFDRMQICSSMDKIICIEENIAYYIVEQYEKYSLTKK